MKSQLIQNRAGTSVIQVRELCPLGFDQPLSQKKKKKMHLTSSKHVGPSDAVSGPTVVKRHHRTTLQTPRSLNRISADQLLPIACSF